MEKVILLIEDDPHIGDLLELHFQDLGYTLSRAHDGLEGIEKFGKRRYDLIILDVMLPKIDGLDVCREIRSRDRFTPILMLTSKSEEIDKVLGLELGADDYLTKPFSIRELLARIKVIFRRIEADKQSMSHDSSADTMTIGDLHIDQSKRKVIINSDPVTLTAKEFDLLVQFASNPGRVYTRQELLDLVWGYRFSGYDHTVNSHINRLRRKIEKDPSHPRYIQTVWGVGYRFSDREEMV